MCNVFKVQEYACITVVNLLSGTPWDLALTWERPGGGSRFPDSDQLSLGCCNHLGNEPADAKSFSLSLNF